MDGVDEAGGRSDCVDQMEKMKRMKWMDWMGSMVARRRRHVDARNGKRGGEEVEGCSGTIEGEKRRQEPRQGNALNGGCRKPQT